MAWKVDGAQKDVQSITADWELTREDLIEGVAVKEIKTVPKSNGYLVEIYRREWALDNRDVDQVFQVTLQPGGVSAWHAHATTTDRLFVNVGLVRVVLYDGRDESPTRGTINEFKVGEKRPALIVVPPKVWHGVQNLDAGPSSVLNLVDQAYRYEDPDHWRVPADSPEIPYRLSET